MLAKSSLRIDIFAYSLAAILEDNLSSYIISTVSNMLALYYSLDKNLRQAEPNMPNYGDICAGRIKNFLQEKVVLEEEFSVALSLFTVAITPEPPPTEDLPSLNKIRDQEQGANIICQAILGDEALEHETALLSDAMDDILGDAQASEIVNFMSINPDIVLKVLRGKKRHSSEIKTMLTQAAMASTQNKSIVSDFAQVGGLLACSMLAFAGNIVAVSSFTAIAAAAIIPVSIAALKYGSFIGEKIGATIAGYEKNYATSMLMKQGVLQHITSEFTDANMQIVEIKNKDLVPKKEIAKIDLMDITKDLLAHVDFSSNITKVSRNNSTQDIKTEKDKDRIR